MASHARIKITAGFWQSLCQLGIDVNHVVRKAQLPLTIITSPFVTTAQYFAIWNAYSDIIGDTAKAIIKLATVFETSHYPPAVLATYHARDYRDALKRMARYKQLCPPEGLHIVEKGDECTIELEWLYFEQPGPPILVGITLEEAIMPSGQMPQYCMTKSMLLLLSKSLSKLTIGKEVTVNTIMPGPTLSENVYQIIDSIYSDENMAFEEKEKKFMSTNLPQSEIQRFIRPSEIGRLAAFVCSPYASAFKSSPIRMDGGMVPTIY